MIFYDWKCRIWRKAEAPVVKAPEPDWYSDVYVPVHVEKYCFQYVTSFLVKNQPDWPAVTAELCKIVKHECSVGNLNSDDQFHFTIGEKPSRVLGT